MSLLNRTPVRCLTPVLRSVTQQRRKRAERRTGIRIERSPASSQVRGSMSWRVRTNRYARCDRSPPGVPVGPRGREGGAIPHGSSSVRSAWSPGSAAGDRSRRGSAVWRLMNTGLRQQQKDGGGSGDYHGPRGERVQPVRRPGSICFPDPRSHGSDYATAAL